MPARLSDGWLPCAAVNVSFSSSQRIMQPKLNVAVTGSSAWLVPGTREACGTTVPGTTGPEQLRAVREIERVERAAHRVPHAQARRVDRLGARREAGDVVGDVDEDFVGIGPDVRIGGRHGGPFYRARRFRYVPCS